MCGKYGMLTLTHTGNLLRHRQEEVEHFNVRKGVEANRLRLQLAELQVQHRYQPAGQRARKQGRQRRWERGKSEETEAAMRGREKEKKLEKN